MFRPAVAAAILCASVSLARPNPTRLKNAFERHAAAMVEVVGPKARGAGVMVAAEGLVATSVDFVSLYDAKVIVGGEERDGEVVFADAKLKVAVVRIKQGGSFAAAPVQTKGAPKRGAWLLGIFRDAKSGKSRPKEGPLLSAASRKSPFVEVGFPLPPGSPVIDERGELVAISIGKRGAYSSRAVPVERIREGLQASVTK